MTADLDSDAIPAPDTEGLLETVLPDGERVFCTHELEVASVHRQVCGYLHHGIRLEPSATVFDVGANIGLFTRLVGALRRAVVNEVTLRGVVYPLLRAAERRALLRPLVPSLCAKVTLYHFHAGRRDRGRGLQLDLSRVVPG